MCTRVDRQGCTLFLRKLVSGRILQASFIELHENSGFFFHPIVCCHWTSPYLDWTRVEVLQMLPLSNVLLSTANLPQFDMCCLATECWRCPFLPFCLHLRPVHFYTNSLSFSGHGNDSLLETIDNLHAHGAISIPCLAYCARIVAANRWGLCTCARLILLSAYWESISSAFDIKLPTMKNRRSHPW